MKGRPIQIFPFSCFESFARHYFRDQRLAGRRQGEFGISTQRSQREHGVPRRSLRGAYACAPARHCAWNLKLNIESHGSFALLRMTGCDNFSCLFVCFVGERWKASWGQAAPPAVLRARPAVTPYLNRRHGNTEPTIRGPFPNPIPETFSRRGLRKFRLLVFGETFSCRCCVLAARYLSAHLRARQVGNNLSSDSYGFSTRKVPFIITEWPGKLQM